MNRWIDAMFRLTFRLGPVVLWLWLWGLPLPSAATPTLEQEIRTTFVTPHTAWAKPYAGGTTRVLFFSGYKNIQAWEIVELMQRFEIQADAAYWTRGWDKPPRFQWHGRAGSLTTADCVQ